VPETAKDNASKGTIISVDDQMVINGMPRCHDYEEGSRVVIGRYAGITIKHNDQDYVILNISDILAHLEPVHAHG
jgi:co-chaperonin GroES (HSP10)